MKGNSHYTSNIIYYYRINWLRAKLSMKTDQQRQRITSLILNRKKVQPLFQIQSNQVEKSLKTKTSFKNS